MSISWLKVPGTLLKLVIGNERTNVVSGQPSSDATPAATVFNDPPDDSAGSKKRESSAHEDPTARKAHRLHEPQMQQGHDAAGHPHAALPKSSAGGPTSSAQEGLTGPVRSHHRKTVSAGSGFSLSSTVSTTGTTTGAYTGFTQNGQYDLTHDVILRGEFISDQQAKVHLMIRSFPLHFTVHSKPILHCRQLL